MTEVVPFPKPRTGRVFRNLQSRDGKELLGLVAP